MTYREYLMKAEGYNRYQAIENHRLRMLTYCIVKPYLKDQNLSVYEFMPLPNDPTPEEIRQSEQELIDKATAEAHASRLEILSLYKNRKNGGT